MKEQPPIMRYLLGILVLVPMASFLLGGCYTMTRTETDLYTITLSDTTIREEVNNPPGSQRGGTIHPSPREIEITRRYVQRDSTVKRYYPSFLRYGGIEAASFFGTGGSTDGTGNGVFGLYDLITQNRVDDTKLFTANMYRFMPYEIRLRWFDDSPNWTIGTAGFEVFTNQLDSSAEIEGDELLMGAAPIYVRKRFFFRDEPPYIMAVPFFGVSYAPSVYVNFGATLDIGSYGGFNLRGYAGYINGVSNPYTDELNTNTVAFPYFGIGISALDFVNRTEELYIEWKDHDHSAVEVAGLNVDVVKALDSEGAFLVDENELTGDPLVTGTIARLATSTFPIPIADSNFWVGTSLVNLIALDSRAIAFSVLPIRAGYRWDLFNNELNFEPFVEYNYYPSSALHVGSRLALTIPDLVEWLPFPFTLNVVGGYVTGSSNFDVVVDLDDLGGADDFSTPYVGVGLGIGDVLRKAREVLD